MGENPLRRRPRQQDPNIVLRTLCDFGSARKRQKAKWFHVHVPPHPFFGPTRGEVILVQQKDHFRIGNLMQEGETYAERW